MNTKLFLFLCALVACIASCSNNAAEQGGIIIDSVVHNGQASAYGKLMRYFPLDSVGPNGEKLYKTIPHVMLINQNGDSFATDVRGKIILVDFFFATCTGTCPRMNKQMTRIQDAFKNDTNIILVSYTVDPEEDSVPVLKAYANQYKAIPNKWFFLTGNKKSIYDLARYNYYLDVEPGNGDSEDFIHSDQITICDKQGIIRGYYLGTDSLVVDSLINDVKILRQEK